MMPHLDEGVLQALLDGELESAEATEAQRHSASCAECRARLEELERQGVILSSALSLLDAPMTAVPLKAPPSVRRSSWSTAPLARAAALLLTFAAAASATIPGSPVRDWIGERIRPAQAPIAMEAPAAPDARTTSLAAEALEAAAETGVSVEPAGGRLRIVVTGASPELQVRALLVDSRRGGVYAIGGATSARFRTAQGLVEVFDAGAGELRLEIPRQAQSASVVIDGVTYLEKEGDQLRLEAAGSDRSEAEIVFQVQR